MKVRANSFYIYQPCLLDIADGRTDLKAGDLVQVVNLPGCPRANTMKHAHVNKGGKFAGLVCTASLVSRAEYAKQWNDAIRGKTAPATCPAAAPGCNPDSFANCGRPSVDVLIPREFERTDTGRILEKGAIVQGAPIGAPSWPKGRAPNSQDYTGTIEFADGSSKVRNRRLFWSTNRGKRRAMLNFQKYLMRLFPEWKRISIDPIGPDCHNV